MQSVWRRLVLTIAAAGLAACGGSDKGGCSDIVCAPTTTPDAIRNFSVSPPTSTLTTGQSVQLVPAVTTGASSVSVSFSYASSAPGTASVSSAGLVTAVAPGTAVITVVASGSGTGTIPASLTANASVTVVTPPPVVVSISPASLTLNVGEPGTMSVQITGGSPTPTLASCLSSQSAVATVAVSGSACRVTAVGAGNATITATTSGGQQASAQVTVQALPPALTGFTVIPASVNLAPNAAAPLAFSPGLGGAGVAVSYTCVSSDALVVTVSAACVLTAVGTGSAKVTVTATGSGAGFATTTLAASVNVTVAPSQPGVSAVTVQPTSLSLQAGQTSQLLAVATQPTGAPAAAISYGTSATSVATVSASGLVTAVAAGSAVITVTATTPANASFGAATVTAQVAVTVTALPPALVGPFTVSPSPLTLAAGQITTPTRNPNPANGSVAVSYTYTSSNASVATVSAAGAIAGVAPGTTTITIMASGSGVGYSTNALTATLPVTVTAPTPALLGPITVSPTTSTLNIGQTASLVTNANPAAGVSVNYSYISSAPNTASVSSTGVVTALAPGPATIQVTATGSGLGYTTNSLVVTSEVIVRSPLVACQIVNRTYPITNVASTLTLNDCLRASGARATYSRIVNTAQRTVLFQVNAVFNGAGVFIATDTSALALSSTSATGAVGGYFLLPAGTWLFGVAGANAATGNFAMDANTDVDDVDNCRNVAILGGVTTNQRLSANSCVDPFNATLRYDDFSVFAPGRACAIEMRVTGAAGSMVDPFLNVYNAAGNTVVGFNNNIDANTRNARVNFANCVDPSGSVLRLRPTSLNAGDYGNYVLVVTFTPPLP